ncbi:MAG: tetratricopeptide repeat protein, partial [Myxococcaceae bacterium]
MNPRSLAVLLVMQSTLAFARAPDPAATRAAEHAQAALDTAGSPRGAAHLFRLHSFLPELEDLGPLTQTYSTLLSRGGVDPFTRAQARLLSAELERARGRLSRAGDLLAPLGFLSKFYVVGSFDNEGKSGCDTDFGPEASPLNLTAVYPAQGREVGWRKLSVQPLDGYIDLSAVVSPRKEAVVYALALLETQGESQIDLGIGASGAFKLWVNGQLATKTDRYNVPRPDQSRVSVKLKKGLNRVMLKVCQESGPLGFYLRREHKGGSAVTSVLPDSVPPMEKGPSPSASSLPTLTTAMAAELKKKASPTLRAEYASILDGQRAFDGREHTDTVEAEKAADAEPGNVHLQLLAAGLQDEDHNLRRKYLDAALKADPASPAARLMMAQHESARGRGERALAILDALIKDQPSFAAARLEQARVYESLGEWPRAVATVEETLRDLPRVPSVIREAATIARRMDRSAQALERLRVAVALRYNDVSSRRAMASLFADLGRVDEAAKELEIILKLDPFDNGTRLRLAELLAANGRKEASEKLFAEAKSIAADDSEVYEREGRALLAAGSRAEALTAFERSLALRPQNPALKEALRALKGDNTSHGTEYVLDVKALSKQAD